MTWEELCEKAKEMGYYYWEYPKPNLANDNIQFFKDGTVRVYVYFEDDSDYCEIAHNRTPDQMYQIMLALED